MRVHPLSFEETYKIKLTKRFGGVVDNIISSIKKGKKKILILGEKGAGKTTLLRIIEEKLAKEGKKTKRIIPTITQILKAINEAKDLDVVLIDDLDLVLESEISIDDLRIRELMEKTKAVICAINKENYEKISKEFKFDETYELKKPSFDEFKEILKANMEELPKFLTEKELKKIYEGSNADLSTATLLLSFLLEERKR